MSVTIQDMTTDITVSPTGSRGSGDGAPAPGSVSADEIGIEELRAIVRELVAEEIERHRRLAIER